jgi:single-strand DNA-binding protein
MNKVIVLGNLGRDPEIGTTKDGKRYARLSLATSNTWRDKVTGEKREKTEWHKIVAWGDGLCGVLQQYAKKGSKLLVEGKLSTRKWHDEKIGQDRYTTEIVVQGPGAQIELLGDSSGGGGVPPPEEAPEGRFSASEYWGDDAA